MRKIVIALVLLVVGIGCFASTKSVSVFDSNNKLILTTKYDNDSDSVSFYDLEQDEITVDLTVDSFSIYINDDMESLTFVGSDEIKQWDKFSRVSGNELTDDEGNIVGYGLGFLTKDGYLYVVLIYND